MQIRQAITAAIVLVSAFFGCPEVSHAQFEVKAEPLTIGTDGALKLDKSQINDLLRKKGLAPDSTSAIHLTMQYSGQGVRLGALKEKDVLDLWKVLSPDQRDELLDKLKPGPLVPPEVLPGSSVPFWKSGPSPYHIPPYETTPPLSLIRNGSEIPLDQVKDIGARQTEVDACEAASIAARKWVGTNEIESSLISSYQQSLSNWISACLTQDVGDTASLAGLDVALVKQVVGILSYGSTRFCTGLLKDGKVITARHCFIKNGDASVGQPATWRCPSKPGADDLWCATAADRSTLQFRRASDPATPIPLSLAESGLVTPSNYEFRTDRVSVAIRSDNHVSLVGVPKVEWDTPKLNEQVWLAGPVVSATQADKYQGLYWSKFLAGKCRIVELEGECVRHYCQAVGGFSGAPLVTKTTVAGGQGVVKVTGIHLGASESYEECRSNTVRLNIAQKVVQ